jgi:hypothetical protein
MSEDEKRRRRKDLADAVLRIIQIMLTIAGLMRDRLSGGGYATWSHTRLFLFGRVRIRTTTP